MAYTLSPSTLSLFEECPRCFWLHFRMGIKRPDSLFSSLPSGMDKLIKSYFDGFRKRKELPPELAQLNEVALYQNKDMLKIWRNNFKGIRWTDNKGNMLKGAVDEILVHNNKLIVLDFKTRGFPLKQDTHEHYRTQLNIYNLLLRKNGFQTEDYSYLLFFYPMSVKGQGYVRFELVLIKLTVNTEQAELLFNRAIECLEGSIPEASEDCDYCKYTSKLLSFEKHL